MNEFAVPARILAWVTTRGRPASLTAIIILAVTLRLGIGVFLGFNAPPDKAACGADTVEFERMAWSAARGEGFRLYEGGAPTAFRAPGYPLLLAGLYGLAGRVHWVNRLALSIIGAGTCWLVYLLALRIVRRARAAATTERDAYAVALLAALLVAVLPLQFYWCGHFMSEPLAAGLNVAACLALVHGEKKESKVEGRKSKDGCTAFVAGILCGVAALTRAASLLFPAVVLGFWFLFPRSRPKKVLWRGGALLAGLLLVILPWTIRNVVVLERFSLISTNGGSTFWGANNAIVAERGPKWGSWISTTHVDRELKEKEVWSLPNEVDQDRKEWQLGLRFVRENPGKIPMLLAGKFYRLLKPFPDSANKIYRVITGLAWIGLFPVSLIGMVLVARQPDLRRRFLPVSAQLLALLATTAVFYGSERFRMPYEPFLAIYAAVALSALVRRIEPRRHGDAEERRREGEKPVLSMPSARTGHLQGETGDRRSAD